METPGPYGGDGGRDGAPTAEVEGIWADGEDGDADETGLGNAMANMIQQQSPPPGAGRPNHPQGKTPAVSSLIFTCFQSICSGTTHINGHRRTPQEYRYRGAPPL